MTTRPAYRDLPGGRADGLYGPDDQLGALNLLTPERTTAAAGLVRTGAVFALNAPLDWPSPHPASVRRQPPRHVVYSHDGGRDDHLDSFYPQFGSQWDGFLHVYDAENGCFHNANTDESRGIEAWARRGIVGRGVLLDVARWRAEQGRPIDWRARDTVGVRDLEGCAAAQGVSVDEGTILLLRFGWETGWNADRAAGATPVPPAEFRSPGLAAGTDTVERLWDWGVAAVAADNLAVESYPFDDGFLHVDLLVRAGIPLGEFWHLDELAAACHDAGRYEFLLTAAPLHVPGGIGSTANAVAVL